MRARRFCGFHCVAVGTLTANSSGSSPRGRGTHAKTVHYLDEALRNAYYDGPMYSGISDNKADVYAEQGLLKTGAIFADNGFCSYTSNEDFARNWKDGLVICLKQGGKGCASVKSISKFPEED